LTGHQFGWTLPTRSRALAAHEDAMIEALTTQVLGTELTTQKEVIGRRELRFSTNELARAFVALPASPLLGPDETYRKADAVDSSVASRQWKFFSRRARTRWSGV